MEAQKKVLSLVLCVAMMLSVMVVGAGAAFSDQSKIKNTEAVDMCTALNIIGGYPDGTFKPEGNITRAEVTKMICVALNGGKEPNVGTNATPTFSDVRTNPNSAWAEGYIESCYAQGIVSGVGGGKFAPAGNVTATQMAKMLLVALGYNADNEGFTGNAWATNVNVRASQKGLYEDLENIDVNAALTRDNAAQMIWNALNAYEVEYKTTLITDSKGQLTSQITVQDKLVQGTEGFVKITLLEDKYESKTATGILTHIEWNDTDKEYKYTIGEDVKNAQGVVTTAAPTFQSASDFSDLFGMNVKVVYTKDKKTNDIKVFGIVPKDSKILAKGIMDDIEYSDTKEIKVDGTKYKTDEAVSSLKAQAFNGGKVDLFNSKAVNSTLKPYYTVNVIDNDNDGKVDVVVYLPVTVAKVTYAGSSSITAGKSYKYADENIADGIKKDDYVVIVDKANTKDEKYSITKAEMITGKIEAIKGTDVKVDGTWYKTIDGAQEDNYSLNDEFTLAVVNGFVCHAEESDGVISNDKVILVTKADDAKDTGIDAGTQKVKALFSDGTEKQITVAQVNSQDVKHASTANEAAENTLYTFTTKSNGEYKLKAIDISKYDGTLNGVALVDDGKAYNNATKASATSTMRFADTATIFVVPANGDDAKVITGKALGTWKSISSIDTTKSVLYGKKDGGIVYANVGVVVMNNRAAAPSSGDVQYGFVTADSAVVKEGDDYYVSMTIWNGTSEVTVKADSYYEYVNGGFSTKTDVDEATQVKNYTNSSSQDVGVAFAKQTPISYKTTGDGVISEVRPLNVAPTSSEYLGAVAVTGYQDGKKYVSINGTDYDLTSDTVQMFVDTDAKKGSTSGSITEANEVHGYFVKNAYVVLNTAKDEVEFILVDTQNNLNINTTEGDITLSKGTSLTNVAIDNVDRVVELKSDTIAKTAVKAGTAEANGIGVAGAGKVVVIAAGSNLAAGDTIRVIAENGDVVDYAVK